MTDKRGRWGRDELRLSTTSIILNTLLLVVIALSYIPQICLVVNRRETTGITSSYVLFTYLFTASQFQLVLIYSTWGRPVADCLMDRELCGLDAYGALVRPIQMTTLWLGSAALLATFVLYPTQQSAQHLHLEVSYYMHQHYPKSILAISIIHACIWIVPAMIFSIPRPMELATFHVGRIFIGYSDHLLIPSCIVLVMSIFPIQIREILRADYSVSDSSLSPITLALQTVAFFLLSLSWKLWVGKPGDPFNIIPDAHNVPLEAIYRLGAWQWVNNLILGAGQGLLLLTYSWVASRQKKCGYQPGLSEASPRLY